MARPLDRRPGRAEVWRRFFQDFFRKVDSILVFFLAKKQKNLCSRVKIFKDTGFILYNIHIKKMRLS